MGQNLSRGDPLKSLWVRCWKRRKDPGQAAAYSRPGCPRGCPRARLPPTPRLTQQAQGAEAQQVPEGPAGLHRDVWPEALSCGWESTRAISFSEPAVAAQHLPGDTLYMFIQGF